MKYNPIKKPLRALRLAGLAGIVALSVGCSPEKQRTYSRNEMFEAPMREVYENPNIQNDNPTEKSIVQKESNLKESMDGKKYYIYSTELVSSTDSRDKLTGKTIGQQHYVTKIYEVSKEEYDALVQQKKVEPKREKTWADYYTEGLLKQLNESAEKKESK